MSIAKADWPARWWHPFWPWDLELINARYDDWLEPTWFNIGPLLCVRLHIGFVIAWWHPKWPRHRQSHGPWENELHGITGIEIHLPFDHGSFEGWGFKIHLWLMGWRLMLSIGDFAQSAKDWRNHERREKQRIEAYE